MEEADRALRRLAAAIDLKRSTLIVTSDHGHTERGGHGGDEPSVTAVPLVMAGRGVRVAISGEARQIDVAPTIAALLGIPVPASNQGETLDVLEGDADARAARSRVLHAQRDRAERDYVARLSLRRSARPGAEGVAAEARRAELLATEAAERRVAAAAIAGAPLLALIGAALVAGRRAALAGTLLGAAGALLNDWLRARLGLSTSLSAINKEDDLLGFLGANMVVALFACVLAVAAAGAVSRPWKECGRGERSLLACLVALAFLCPLVFRIARVYWEAGFTVEWALPDMRLIFGLYLDALALGAVGLFAPAFPWVARRMAGRDPAKPDAPASDQPQSRVVAPRKENQPCALP